MAHVSISRSLFLAAGVGACLVSSAIPQETGGGVPAKKAAPQVSAAPVTRDEVRKTVDKVEGALRKVLQLPKGQASQIAGAQPATRDAIILQLDRLFQMTKPAFRMTPQKVKTDPKTLSAKDPAAKKALENLVAWGFAPRAGLLATGTKETMAPAEFGDSVGFFLNRLSELTHTPNSRFSTYMQRED